jgi:hypothetical protein
MNIPSSTAVVERGFRLLQVMANIVSKKRNRLAERNTCECIDEDMSH